MSDLEQARKISESLVASMREGLGLKDALASLLENKTSPNLLIDIFALIGDPIVLTHQEPEELLAEAHAAQLGVTHPPYNQIIENYVRKPEFTLERAFLKIIFDGERYQDVSSWWRSLVLDLDVARKTRQPTD